MRRYRDKRCWIYEARKSKAGPYMVMGRTEGGVYTASPKAPRRGTMEEAQMDLDRLAERKSWELIKESRPGADAPKAARENV